MLNTDRRIAVVGMSYFGLAAAMAFAKTSKEKVIAFDGNKKKIKALKAGCDCSQGFDAEEITKARIHFTDDADELLDADFFVVAEPLPVNADDRPDMSYLQNTTELLSDYVEKGDIIVYEGAVYPGVTEEFCVPIIEKKSGLRLNRDFYIGYCPERINPGDKNHPFENNVKVVSASTPEALDTIAYVYSQVVTEGIYKAPNIKTAETAKLFENAQRDVNIALVNELSRICDATGVDTKDVVEAAATKKGFFKFTPGLVGGYALDAGSHHLIYKSLKMGHNPKILRATRSVNGGMAKHIAVKTVKHILSSGPSGKVKVAILGFTFKEDYPDVKNTNVISIVRELESYGVEVLLNEPVADKEEVERIIGKPIVPLEFIKDVDAVILPVSHKDYVEGGWSMIIPMLKNGKGFVVDVKSVLNKSIMPEGITLWRL